jgi:beta-glucosidase
VYGGIRLSESRIAEAESVEVHVEVRNAGPRTGSEVVQLYVHDTAASVARPEQELKAFSKIELRAGETRTVRFRLEREAFWHYNPAKGGWMVEPGEFEVRVGRSSRDLPLRARLTVIADKAVAGEHDEPQTERNLRTS